MCFEKFRTFTGLGHSFGSFCPLARASQMVLVVKNLLPMQEM